MPLSRGLVLADQRLECHLEQAGKRRPGQQRCFRRVLLADEPADLANGDNIHRLAGEYLVQPGKWPQAYCETLPRGLGPHGSEARDPTRMKWEPSYGVNSTHFMEMSFTEKKRNGVKGSTSRPTGQRVGLARQDGCVRGRHHPVVNLLLSQLLNLKLLLVLKLLEQGGMPEGNGAPVRT